MIRSNFKFISSKDVINDNFIPSGNISSCDELKFKRFFSTKSNFENSVKFFMAFVFWQNNYSAIAPPVLALISAAVWQLTHKGQQHEQRRSFIWSP